MGLELYPELTPEQVSRWAGAQRHSPGWCHYSLKNPRDTDEAIAMVQEARGVRLKISHFNHDMVAAHWLKLMHYREGYAWDDGFVFPRYRGGWHGTLMDEWNLFARWAASQGYHDILCASFVGNMKAHNWIIDACGFWVVGTRTEASQRAPDGTWMPVVVYAYGEQSMETARQRAEEVYMRGTWIEGDSDV